MISLTFRLLSPIASKLYAGKCLTARLSKGKKNKNVDALVVNMGKSFPCLI